MIKVLRHFRNHPDFLLHTPQQNVQTIKELEKLSQVPLLHIYSENDKSVGHYHQEQYQLHTKGSLQSVILHASDHDFSERGEQETAIQETLNWFARYL